MADANLSLLRQRMAEPRHQGQLAGATGVGAVGNPACGDVVTIYLRVEAGVIVEASFESMGSAYQLATASVLCECITGQAIDKAAARTPECVLEKLLDLPTNKRYLARLSLEALGRAIRNHNAEPGQPEAPPMTDAAAREFVESMLSNGRQWGTLELDAMARADGYSWPTTLVRFLAGLRAEGTIGGEMVGSSWRWWSLSHDGRHAANEQPNNDS